MADDDFEVGDCKSCADVVHQHAEYKGWCPKDMGLTDDEIVATDEQMEAIDRDIDARLAAELEDRGKSDLLKYANSEVPHATGVLSEAMDLVNNGRKTAYGHPAVNLTRIAKLWSVVLDRRVTPREVALCMNQVKVARELESPKRDNLVDGAGYLAIAAEV